MTGSDGQVVVYAPYAKDAASIAGLLREQHIDTVTVSALSELAGHLGEGLGAVLMSEEALIQADWSVLLQAVKDQPSWSSYPFILLIGQKRSADHTERVYRLFPPEVANVMVLERPMSSTALLSAIRWALAGRRRQFLTKSHLDELEQATQQQRMLTRELAHRVKNTIAMLQSIVGQTMRPHPEMAEVQKQIVERFSALARTHDLLFNNDFQEAEFGELVNRTLSVHSRHFVVDGPEIKLSPQAALSFALVIHELATNSIKYGAFFGRCIGTGTCFLGNTDWRGRAATRFHLERKRRAAGVSSGSPGIREPTCNSHPWRAGSLSDQLPARRLPTRLYGRSFSSGSHRYPNALIFKHPDAEEGPFEFERNHTVGFGRLGSADVQM